MAPKKDTNVTLARVRLPRAAKDKPKTSPELVPKTTPQTIKKVPGRSKKSVPETISTSETSSARKVKGKGRAVTTGEPSISTPSDQIIRQEATYPNPFSTESSRKNTAALLSQWDSTKSPAFCSPNSGNRLVNGTPKSKSPRSARSKHDRSCSILDKGHIAIPPPSSKDRGEQTSQLFDVNKQQRLNSLAEGKFPDPTYPRASISDGTEPSPGFNAAMGFRYSPGFGGPHGFNTSPRNQSVFNLARNGSTIPGTGVLSSSGTIKTGDQTNHGGIADAGRSLRADGEGLNISSSKKVSTVPAGGFQQYSSGFGPQYPQTITQYSDSASTNWPYSMDWYQNRFSGQVNTAPQSLGSYGPWFGPGHTRDFDSEKQDWYADWMASQQNFPSIPDYLSNPMIGYYPMPDFEPADANIPHQTAPGLDQAAQGATAIDEPEPQGIRESRMTREKTMLVPGGKIVKTTTTVFTPTDEERNKKGNNVEQNVEDKVGIVVVDKEGNVDVESGDWLAGFNRIEGWEVEALLGQSKRWRSCRNRNGVTKKVITKKTNHKKPTTSKKAVASLQQPVLPQPHPNFPKFTQLASTKFGTLNNSISNPISPSIDFIPFDHQRLTDTRSTRSRATRISKPKPQPVKKAAAKKATPKVKSKTPTPTPTPTPKPKATASRVTKPTVTPARSLRSTKSSSKAKPSETKSGPKPSPSKSKSSSAKESTKAKAAGKQAAAKQKKMQKIIDPGKSPKSAGDSTRNGVNFMNGFTRNTTELQKEVQRDQALASQAAENLERFRGKGAEQASQHFEKLIENVEKGRKELERRNKKPNS
ncbi:hypothetical protein BELL_0423g00060 [Botrytis elliptica]|uniref:Uncharacterized protein n=1 Tax=Botrytis elliptica TaxID=278938 RepID=A0A4Z1JV11_9HELO|nr:hypothetical protein EAE99_001761 [Botrytis elliptica]TGO72737.1 hypothetical protein BELL_0423g00060 [Botrytis elliptica]